MQFVEFNIGKEKFCVDINKVRYIEKFQDITKVPNVPKYIEGIINIHGEIIAVYNLHQKFVLNQIKFTEDTVFIIVNIGDIGIGLLADDVSEIIDEKDYQIEPTPKMILGSSKYISGVLKLEDSIVMILNIDEIVNSQEQEKISSFINENKELE